jgi:hypothetical protein
MGKEVGHCGVGIALILVVRRERGRHQGFNGSWRGLCLLLPEALRRLTTCIYDIIIAD